MQLTQVIQEHGTGHLMEVIQMVTTMKQNALMVYILYRITFGLVSISWVEDLNLPTLVELVALISLLTISLHVNSKQVGASVMQIS